MRDPVSGAASGAQIKAIQLARLDRLVRAVLGSNRFYQAKLGAAGVSEPPSTLADFSARVPFTTKQELIDDQRANAPYGSDLTFEPARYTRFSQTSGTSGTPMRWLDTPESWNWMLDNWAVVYRAAGVDAADRLFFAFSFGPFLGFWTAFEAATRMGAMAIPGGGMPSTARLATIVASGATVLCCTPTYALHLAEVARREKIDLGAARLRSIIVAGEPGGSIPATRRELERLWPGVRIVDHHGMTETGPVSYGCPVRHGVLHVIESAYYAEVIDPQTLETVPPGATGELVLTNLGRLGSPVLRYRTGDFVRASEPGQCACGTHEMAIAGGILGRTDDMIVVRGVNVYPAAIEEVLRSCGGVAEYRVLVSRRLSLVELGLELEAGPGVNAPALAHGVENALRDALSLRIPVTVVPAGSLPRFEMKARRWIRE